MDEIRQLTVENLQQSLERIRREEAQRLKLDRIAEAMLACGFDPGAVGRLCLEGVLSCLDFERGFLFVLRSQAEGVGKDTEAAQLQPIASRLLHGSPSAPEWANVLNPEFAVDRAVIKRAMTAMIPMAVNDCLIRPSSAHEETHRAVLCYPFSFAPSIPGLLYVDRGLGKGEIAEREQQLLSELASRFLPVLRASYLAVEVGSIIARQGGAPRTAEQDGVTTGDSDVEPAPETKEVPSFHGIVGHDEKLQKIFRIVQKVKDTDLNICIFGESGTGKELLAKAIHDASRRREKTFVAENCGAIAENLLESELFGHVRGAFTGADEDRHGLFEIASGGSLFLDEISDMSEGMQRKLLRVLQEGVIRPIGGKHTIKVDTRVICASNRDLRTLVAKGKFRADLFYRLNVITIEIPPLRERRADVPLLISHVIDQLATEEGVRKRFSQSAMRALVNYAWPGNVRELFNVVRRAFLTCPGRLIARKDVVGYLKAENASPRSGVNVERDEDELILRIPARDSFNEIIDECERVILANSLQQCGWNKSKVTKALRIPRQSLYNKIEKYNLVRTWGLEGTAGASG